jgi:hypothetical protein
VTALLSFSSLNSRVSEKHSTPRHGVTGFVVPSKKAFSDRTCRLRRCIQLYIPFASCPLPPAVVLKENIAVLWAVFLFIFTKLSLHPPGCNVNHTLLSIAVRHNRHQRILYF